MTCWRCGRVEHADWCSDGTSTDCDHCGGGSIVRLAPRIHPHEQPIGTEAPPAARVPAWRLHEPTRVAEPA